MKNWLARLVPFILAGVALVAFVFGMILLAYLFIFGAVVGLVLFAIAWIKGRFFASKQMTRSKDTKRPPHTLDQ